MPNTTTGKGKERPYKPSWIDRFTNWVEKLPLSGWVFYVCFGCLLILLQIIILWVDGGLQAEELIPVIIFNGLATSFVLALIHLLDRQAVTALNTMRPSLDLDEADFEKYQYKLSNMPSRATLIACFAMVVVVVLVERLSIAPIRYAALEQLPIFSIIFQIIDKSSGFVFGGFIYHTIRQLSLVNTINSNHICIDLFNLGPLRAFSGLTASTALGLVFGIYGWMLINPELLADPISFSFTVAITILAIVVFVWPLIGVHRLMEMEKESRLHDIDLRFEKVFSKFNQKVQDEDYSALESLNWTIAGLEIQQKRIGAIPTWPWKPETARFTLTAIALPLILRVLQFLVEQTFN